MGWGDPHRPRTVPDVGGRDVGKSAAASTTVAELAALARRTAMALAEVGEGERGEHCHVAVCQDGSIHLRFCHHEFTSNYPAAAKAISFDPEFELNDTSP